MSQSNRHVAFVSPLPPPAGGIATWTETIRNRGLGEDWRISIVNTRMRDGRSVADQKTGLFTEVFRTFIVLFGLLRVLVFHRPNIVHVNCSLSERGVFRDALVIATARMFRVAVVSNLRGNFLPGERVAFSRLTQTVYRFIFRRSQKIVALSTNSKLGVQKLGNFDEKTIVMPNFIDKNGIPEKTQNDEKRFRIGYLGTLTESKGLSTIFETATQLSEYDFVLIGDTPASDESQDLVTDITNLSNITMIGPLPHQPALELIAGCNVLLFPSHSEGFPIAVAEAMAIGLPVVAAPVGAIPEMIDTPNGGYLIPPDQKDAYVEALSTLSTDPVLAQKLGAHNKNKARTLYAYEDVIARWRKIYLSIT